MYWASRIFMTNGALLTQDSTVREHSPQGITPKSALIGFQSGSVVLMHGESYAYGVLQIVSVPRAKDLSELWGLDY